MPLMSEAQRWFGHTRLPLVRRPDQTHRVRLVESQPRRRVNLPMAIGHRAYSREWSNRPFHLQSPHQPSLPGRPPAVEPTPQLVQDLTGQGDGTPMTRPNHPIFPREI